MNSTVYAGKNKVVLVIIALLLLIPAFLAIYLGLNSDTGTVLAHRVNKIDVVSPDGQSFSLTENTDFELYASVFENAKLIDANFRDVSAENPYTVSFSETDGITKQYNFFMTNSSDGCIYTDQENNYYLLGEDDAVALLERAEFASVNSYAVVPYAAITVSDITDTLEPSSGTWSYLSADGNFETKEITGADEQKTVSISLSSIGSLAFYSSVAPDNVTVTLSKDGVVKHEGAYENLLNSEVMSANDTYYDLVISAEWTQKEGCSYFGKVTYTAKMLYDVAPTYSIIYNGIVSKGDFTIIKMQNFNDGDKLFASCDYPFPSELQVFRSDAGYSYAFLPAEYSSVASGKYDLVLSLEDGSSQTLSVTVRDGRNPTVTSQDMLVSDTDLQNAFTSDAFEQLKTTVSEIMANSSPTQLWEGKFVYPDSANKGTVGTGMAQYGTNRIVRGLYQSEYVHPGIDIAMTEGADVLAANHGKVVFAGELTLTGNTVIIDHGCSIFTYYSHLSGISVSVGDNVSKSSVIGTAGSTGFAAALDGAVCNKASQVQFCASVDGVFVNPYYLWKSGVVFDD